MHFTKLIINLLFFITISAHCFSSKKKIDVSQDLKLLNKYIGVQETYKKLKTERIAVLENALLSRNFSQEEQFYRTFLLYEEYSTYKYDSMYVFADKLRTLAQQMNNKDFIVKAELTIVNSFLWGGLFKDATEYFNQIDTTGINKQTKIEYWSNYFDLTFESGLYARYNKVLFPVYKQKMENALKHIEDLSPKDIELILGKKVKLAFHNNESKDAIRYSMQLKEIVQPKDSTSIEYSELLGNIGYNYMDMGDTIRGMHYMTKSAIIGIKQGSRKYPALRRIAEATYALGYLEDAYNYIQLSMSNAKFFGSRYRIYEASKILPKVDSDLNDLTKKQKTSISNLLIITWIFAALLLLVIGLYIRRNNKLKAVRKKLKEQNNLLTENNEKIKLIVLELSEANKIKEAGIGQLFNSNIEFYNKLETLKTSIVRRIKTRQINDLEDFVNKSDLFDSRDKFIGNFDMMFLQLFPNFVVSFNSLLKPENRIIATEKDKLTPELRIFALIRIGFSKNEVIAKFLNYSVSTVKNYKTKIKNCSIIPKDEFEEHLMKIT